MTVLSSTRGWKDFTFFVSSGGCSLAIGKIVDNVPPNLAARKIPSLPGKTLKVSKGPRGATRTTRKSFTIPFSSLYSAGKKIRGHEPTLVC